MSQLLSTPETHRDRIIETFTLCQGRKVPDLNGRNLSQNWKQPDKISDFP
ncbi:unnamed protein product [Moneuplotes crassus]|uniref:Uncharacterized protein n=1 Tax=Euplotes crassus TaxID=5936 RepID=A0AAD1ULQ3_EUPCR|nr:unnamed protein product [Moneuplotes crassus]